MAKKAVTATKSPRVAVRGAKRSTKKSVPGTAKGNQLKRGRSTRAV